MIAFDPDPGGLSHRSQRLRRSGVLEDFLLFGPSIASLFIGVAAR